jgi:single-strand DNA-binding protein
MLNKVLLIARVSSQPRTVKLPSGTVIARVDVAYNRRYQDKNGQWQEETHFFEIEAYGRVALKLQEIAKKGNLLLIEGRLTQNSWEKDGKKQNKVRVRAVKVQLLGTPKKAENIDAKQQQEAIEEEVIAF